MTPRRPAEPATSRVARLLTMVPWLVSRQGIEVSAAARGLGVSETQLREDLDLLFLCGYGTMPDELVDVSYEGDRIYIRNAETISAPLQLQLDEAISIVVGLRALAASGVDSDAVGRALATLEAATSQVEALDRVQVAPDGEAAREELQVRDIARSGIDSGRRLRLTYVVPSRDERTERDVDPWRLVSDGGHWYLHGWCHRAGDERVFRLDRVERIEVLDQPADPPGERGTRDLTEGIYRAGEDAVEITLALAPRARWVAEYYPVTSRERASDGDLVVTLPSADPDLIVRLVLRLGGLARVLGPPDVREDVRRRATAGLDAGRLH